MVIQNLFFISDQFRTSNIPKLVRTSLFYELNKFAKKKEVSTVLVAIRIGQLV